MYTHTHIWDSTKRYSRFRRKKMKKKKKNFVENTDLQSKSVSIDSILLSRKEENSY